MNPIKKFICNAKDCPYPAVNCRFSQDGDEWSSFATVNGKRYSCEREWEVTLNVRR